MRDVDLLATLSQVAQIARTLPAWVQLAATYAYESIQRWGPPAITCQWPLIRVARMLHISYAVDSDEFKRIALLPQRSPEWLRLRAGWADMSDADINKWVVRAPLVSSSVVSEVLGHKKGYIRNTSAALLEQMWSIKKVFPTFVQFSTQRGTACEPLVMELTCEVLQAIVRKKWPRATVTIREVGLQVCMNHPNMAVSSDGTIEIYNPDTRTLYYWALEMKVKAVEASGPYPVIKPEYYDQVQHTCAVLGLDEYVFVCLSSDNLSVEFFKFDAVAWARHFGAIQKFYWRQLWPCVWMKHMTLLHTPNVSIFPEPGNMADPLITELKSMRIHVANDPVMNAVLSEMRSINL